MKFGVLRFPGSCDEVDALNAARKVADAELLWHGERDLKGADAIVVPGGFSYGDYLRAGASARFAPVMESVIEWENDSINAWGAWLPAVRDLSNLVAKVIEKGLHLPDAAERLRLVTVAAGQVAARVAPAVVPTVTLADHEAEVAKNTKLLRHR